MARRLLAIAEQQEKVAVVTGQVPSVLKELALAEQSC